MKLKRLIPCLLLTALFPLFTRAQFLNWNYHNIMDDIAESGSYPDMQIDPATGTIHVVYWNLGQDKLIYAYKTNAAAPWVREYVDIQHPNGFRSALVLDATGTPHVAYFENAGGYTKVRYAYRTGAGAWNIEALPDDAVNTWGDYGSNSAVNSSESINQSIDIEFDANGNPHIIFFDAWATITNAPVCESISQWDFKTVHCWKDGGVWKAKNLGIVPGRYNVCFNSNPLPPQGDRYGEFSDLLRMPDGTLKISTNSRYNNDVLTFDNLGTDTTWGANPFDSLTRSPILSPYSAWGRVYFTWEGNSAWVSPDTAEHFVYCGSFVYGQNFCCMGDIGRMFYTRRTADTITYHDFGGGIYRSHTRVMTSGDTLYITYADLTNFQLMLAESVDDGLTWTQDTILDIIPVSRSPISLEGDSLYVLAYDAYRERLTLCKRHRNGGDWVYDQLTYSENRGANFDGVMLEVNADTVLYSTHIDSYNDKLYFTGGTRSSGWDTWTITELDTTSTEFSTPSVTASQNGTVCIAYGADSLLKMATWNGTVWSYEVVDSNAYAWGTDMALSSQDSIFISWFNSDTRRLEFASRHLSGGTWRITAPDTSTQSHGESPSLITLSTGEPMLAYYAEHNLSLCIARRTGGVWTADSLYGNGFVAVGRFNSLALKPGDRPMISFLDEQNNRLYLGEDDGSGNWTFSLVDTSGVYSMGKPVRLQSDRFGNPWVAYNFFTNFDQVKLLHRDTQWRQVSVSTQGRIANHFGYYIFGNDMYIAGQKSDPQSRGLAMVEAPNGIFVDRDLPVTAAGPQLSCYPNPFGHETFLNLHLDAAAMVSVQVFDIQGRLVAHPVPAQQLAPGEYTWLLEGDALAPGMYFWVMESPQGRQSGKLIRLQP